MQENKIHLICNAHLDPVWQWQWEEGYAEAISTFRTAVQLLNEHEELIFNHNEAVLYEWILEYDPYLFAEIQRLVKLGRWVISGGWYLQPDVNIPGTESIIRHILKGQLFFQKHFQKPPQVAYNFDSFGHSAGLPQILAKAGYKMYIHMRPQKNDLLLPADFYRWQGIDGSEVLGYRINVGLYHTEYENLEQRLNDGVALAVNLKHDIALFWGIGDHGGGATRNDLKIIDEFIKKEKRVEIVHSTPDIFYESIRKFAGEAPVVKGELQRIFTGCYSSLSRIKRAAQKSLYKITQTEMLRTMSWWIYGQDYPEKQLNDAWEKHLFNDFHDILPGTCIEPAEKDALDFYGAAEQIIRRLNFEGAAAFNCDNVKKAYLPVVIMNTNKCDKMVPVETECMISHRPKWSGKWQLKLYKADGTEIPCQEEQPEALLPFNGWRRKISFMANLPQVGFNYYILKAVEAEQEHKTTLPYLNFVIDKIDGLIHKLGDSYLPNYLTGALMKPIVVTDDGDSWGTDYWNYRNAAGKFETESESVHTIEKGAIRNIYQSVMTYNHSKIVMNTIAYTQFPILEYRIRIHWHEEKKRLKLSIPTIFDTDKIFCEVPGGAVWRLADGDEHVHNRWFMLCKKHNGKQIAFGVVNNGQNGIDFKNSEVRLSVLRSAAYCHEQGFKLDKYPVRKYMDQGVHEVKLFVVIGDREKVQKSLSSYADYLSAPPIVYTHLPIGRISQNKQPQKDLFKNLSYQEFLKTEPYNVRLIACKRSSDGDALILRLQESSGITSETSVKLAYPSMEIKFTMLPFEIKTIRVDTDGQWREVNIID